MHWRNFGTGMKFEFGSTFMVAFWMLVIVGTA